MIFGRSSGNRLAFAIARSSRTSTALLIHRSGGKKYTSRAFTSTLNKNYIFRALNPDYEDGISAPRASHASAPLPSARRISLWVHRPSYSIDPKFTVMLAVFGQFLDHDVTATALNQGQDGEPIDCCVESGQEHPECFPVQLGAGDPNYDIYNITCMNFIRSAPAPTNRFGPRQQLNQASAYIDGSVVYGTTTKKVQQLRTSEPYRCIKKEILESE